MSPLNPIREDGEIMDMEEQMPELVDDSENGRQQHKGESTVTTTDNFWTSMAK